MKLKSTLSTIQTFSKSLFAGIAIAGACFLSLPASAQLSTNPDKFLGNITTGWSSDMDYNGLIYSNYWNQVTPENSTKWESVEGTRGQYSWWGADKAANYAQQHNFPFKFHTLVWGSQYPSWLNNLSTEAQYQAIVEWFDAVKAHYPDLPVIDVVNEAIAGHAPAPYKEALGGDGLTGYDWIVRAFELAYERWPDAILVYNDYNTFQWQKTEFIDLVRTLRNAGAPIDAYGCQSHDLGGMNGTNFVAAMEEIQNALKIPMYITEYDIQDDNDANQKWNFMQHIPAMWEADYCAGVTLWGWIYGQTWGDNKSGLIRDGQERSALKWLREYMQTDQARNAVSPFPGMTKEASVYVRPQTVKATIDEPLGIEVRARLKTKTIASVELYVNNQLYKTMTAAPYTTDYVPQQLGAYSLKAVVTATDGTRFERLSGFTAYEPRTPFNSVAREVPGMIEAEEFDQGPDGIAYHDTDKQNEGGTSYRTDAPGVDIVTGNGGLAIGYTAAGEWLEYTVDVKKSGEYSYAVTASSGTTGSGLRLSLVDNGVLRTLAEVSVPKTADNSWDTYKSLEGNCLVNLTAGRHVIRLTITAPYCNIDKFELKCTHETAIQSVDNGQKLTDGAAYDLQGRRVDASYKGIVIINGKKVLRK
ncbi:MAG: endo-1,4-beta-xylanase [Prevotella sp.]|nr:endo-1,4-beta-xylanase [Prevotella sp.]